MPLGDQPVRVTAQTTTFRSTLTVGGIAISEAFHVQDFVRVMVSGQQTVGGAPASLVIDWAIRDSATPGTPEWLRFQSVTLNAAPGAPVNTLLTIGAVWLRFTLTGVAGDVCQLACSAFV